jgi:hypothetical protein
LRAAVRTAPRARACTFRGTLALCSLMKHASPSCVPCVSTVLSTFSTRIPSAANRRARPWLACSSSPAARPPAREAVACVQQQPRGEATDVAGLLRCTNRATRSPGTRCTCMRGCKSARTRSPRAVTAHELTKQLACLRPMGAAVIWRQHAAARM